jgi:hypothetical protein
MIRRRYDGPPCNWYDSRPVRTSNAVRAERATLIARGLLRDAAARRRAQPGLWLAPGERERFEAEARILLRGGLDG